MSEYEATIVRTIITRIKIKAANTQAVRDTIYNYGLIEAANDYPHCVPETTISHVGSVKRLKHTAPK